MADVVDNYTHRFLFSLVCFPFIHRTVKSRTRKGLTLFPYITYKKISEMDSALIYENASLIQLLIIAPRPAGLPKHCYLQRYD